MDKKEVRKTIRGLFKKNGDADGKIKKEDLRKLLEEAFASHEKKVRNSTHSLYGAQLRRRSIQNTPTGSPAS